MASVKAFSGKRYREPSTGSFIPQEQSNCFKTFRPPNVLQVPVDLPAQQNTSYPHQFSNKKLQPFLSNFEIQPENEIFP
jgi:hypothetical protein